MYVCQLLEKRVIVRVREEDVSLAEELMESATQRYEDEVGMQVKVKYTRVWCILEKNFLSIFGEESGGASTRGGYLAS